MKVYVCTGKHCRKKIAESGEALSALPKSARVVKVKCQKICRGPVFGLELDGRLEWFEQVATPKSVRGLTEAAGGRDVNKALGNRRVPRRRGQLRT